MKERPIIMTAESVRAILDGRKTQTRRVVKLSDPTATYALHDDDGWPKSANQFGEWSRDACPFGQSGDRLWVRETWGDIHADHPRCPDGRKPQIGDPLVFLAEPADDYQWSDGPSRGSFCWRSPIHMPRWASRITLEVTGVRVERLQEISRADVDAEGLSPGWDWRGAYQTAWDSLNAKRGYGWEKNPWVWVIEFARTAAEGDESNGNRTATALETTLVNPLKRYAP